MPSETVSNNKNSKRAEAGTVPSSGKKEIIRGLKILAPVLTDTERRALEKAVDKNTSEASYKLKNPEGERKIRIEPRFSEINMNRRSLIYVPKWIITTKAGGVSYNN